MGCRVLGVGFFFNHVVHHRGPDRESRETYVSRLSSAANWLRRPAICIETVERNVCRVNGVTVLTVGLSATISQNAARERLRTLRRSSIAWAGAQPLLSLTSRGDLRGMAAPTYYTADMVRAMPDDGNRYETVHGELLVTPSPTVWHQVILGRLMVSLERYVEDRLGVVLPSPADISWSEDTLVQPDVFVADLEEARTLDWSKVKTLLLVIEVLSPSTARYDRFTKRRLYQEVEIPDYWIVDPDRRLVEVWTPSKELPDVESREVTWRPAGATVPLTIELERLFRPI